MVKVRKRLTKFFIVIFAFYLIYCGLLFFFQNKLIFPAHFAGDVSSILPTPTTEKIELETDEGTTVAWFVPEVLDQRSSAKPVVVFFHGNAELIDQQYGLIDFYHSLGCSVLLVEYRGYGHSEGTPSEKHIVADAVAVLAGVLERDDVDADHLVLHGRSIGGGIAAQVALETEPSAVIVESTFKSISSMASRYGVPSFIVRSPLRSEDAFKSLDVPILIMHGRQDTIVPLHHAYSLNDVAAQSTLVLFDSGHNDLPTHLEQPLYIDSIREHLAGAGVIEEADMPRR